MTNDTHTAALAFGLSIIAAVLAGCVGSAGIGPDGAATAGPESNVIEYVTTHPDGSSTTVRYISAKKGQLEDLEFTKRLSDGSEVTMRLAHAESGDRQGDRALDTANRLAEAVTAVIGPGGLGNKMALVQGRKTAKEQRDEARNERIRQQALLRAEELRLKANQAEIELIKQRELQRARELAELEAGDE